MKNNIIVKFDGYCNFCTFWIKFIKKRDYNNKFILINKNTNKQSIELIINKKKYYKSSAIIIILKNIKFSKIIIFLVQIIPTFILNIFYVLISKYRYFLFGQRKRCYTGKDR